MPQIRDPRKCSLSKTARGIVTELCAKVAHYATERARKKSSEKKQTILRNQLFVSNVADLTIWLDQTGTGASEIGKTCISNTKNK